MGRLHTKAADCEYHEYDRWLTEQFIHGLDDEVMIGEIVRVLMALKDTNEVTRNHILMWTLRMEVQRVQKEVLDNIRDGKEFDFVRQDKQK